MAIDPRRVQQLAKEADASGRLLALDLAGAREALIVLAVVDAEKVAPTPLRPPVGEVPAPDGAR
ncbi:hypothetical protein ACFWF9_17520 [Streptomyces roseolus]|uniref:hypothetical protein n=1 Tax=Streptomyces TaxID=1883 RepID=UPI0036506E28